MKTIDTDNGIFQLADAFVNQTGCNIFLTGKAGTGKTTFLQHIRETTSRNTVVVAPTGVAAIHAGGVTIHSFFQLPIGMFIPGNRPGDLPEQSRAVYTHGDLFRKIRMNSQKRKLIRQLELLIMDEVSMVRADLLDAVDAVLRQVRSKPGQAFGGIQVLMIGDLYQLPPVVPDDEKQLLAEYYESPYFYSAGVMRNSPPVCIELNKIYRQQNDEFITLLNKIRHNRVDDKDLEFINGFFNPSFVPHDSENYITLCSHHYKANAINERELNKLPGQSYQFEASMEGEFNTHAAPADQTLLLKPGAQIMFIKNDKGEEKRYYNGKIGIISEIHAGRIRVKFPGEEESFTLEKEEWKNIRYSYDEESGGINEKELGSFRQYPVRLAWAITIHKSQGLTFDRAIIDAGDSFTSGQVYVAFSRLRSLDGLVLHTRITRQSILTDRQVQENFDFRENDALRNMLKNEQQKYMHQILYNSLDWGKFREAFHDFSDQYRERQVSFRADALQLAKSCLRITQKLEETAGKFKIQLARLLNSGDKGYPLLKDRMDSAAEYFIKRLKDDIDGLLVATFKIASQKSKMQKYLKAIKSLRTAVYSRIGEIEQARDLAKGLSSGKNVSGLLISVVEKNKIAVQPVRIPEIKKPQKGDSRQITFNMHKEGKSIDEIARERMLTRGTIESHLLYFVKEGQLDVQVLVSRKKYGAIHAALKKISFDSLSELKYILGDDYSYTEIRAVMNHLHSLNETGKG